MNKERLLTFGSIVFVVAFAFAVLFLTNFMLDKKEESLLQAEENISFSENYEIEGDKRQYQTLTDEEMRKVMVQAEIYKPWMHEAVEGQIDMIGAIEEATDYIGFLVEKGIISENIINTGFERTAAHLESFYYEEGEYEKYLEESIGEDEINIEKGKDPKIDPIYSFWRISLENDTQQTYINIDIQATTGKVWKISMDVSPDKISTWELDKYIIAYGEYLGLEVKEGSIVLEENSIAYVQPENAFYLLWVENNEVDYRELDYDWIYFELSLRY